MSSGKLIVATMGSYFNRQINVSEAQSTTVDVQTTGAPPGVRAVPRGSRVTFSGKPEREGKYEITIVERRTRKMTIEVRAARPGTWLTKPILSRW
jgi:hypothetical protein